MDGDTSHEPTASKRSLPCSPPWHSVSPTNRPPTQSAAARGSANTSAIFQTAPMAQPMETSAIVFCQKKQKLWWVDNLGIQKDVEKPRLPRKMIHKCWGVPHLCFLVFPCRRLILGVPSLLSLKISDFGLGSLSDTTLYPLGCTSQLQHIPHRPG